MPVALAAGGDLIVVNVDSGRVYFWDHEREAGLDEVAGNANMHLLADSFDEFMQSLIPFDSKTVVLDPAAVISVKLKPGFAEKFKAKP